MSETINWNLAVNVGNGPQLNGADTLTVDGYDKLKVVVPTGGNESVNAGPGNWTSVSLLMISPSKADAQLNYQAAGSATTVPLDGTHLLIGKGAVSLLGTGAAQLKFTNNTAADVSIDIIVGRSAS